MTIVNTSTSAFFDKSITDMASLRGQAEKMQNQMSSGNKLQRSSDDPVAASRLRMLQRSDSLSQIDSSNADRATADLNLADSAMSSFVDYVNRAKELATQAANGTLTSDQRASLGEEMQQIYNNLVSLANSRDAAGHALFGGESSGDAYSLDASGNATYVGTSSSGSLSLGDGQSITRGLTGPEFLNFSVNGSSTDLLSVVKGLADDLQGASTDPQTSARDGMTALDAGLDRLTTAQTVVGTRLNWIDLTSQRRTNLGELRTNEEQTVGGIDIATTVAQLQQTMLVLQASQAGFTKLANLSLFNSIN
jgi:flagellar hook-associated protein 3 FlgL